MLAQQFNFFNTSLLKIAQFFGKKYIGKSSEPLIWMVMAIDGGNVIFFENIRKKNKYTIQNKAIWPAGDTVSLYRQAQFIDPDYDKDFDLVQRFLNCSFMSYFNESSKYQTFWRKDKTVFDGVHTNQWPSSFLVDFDHDVDLDLISDNI